MVEIIEKDDIIQTVIPALLGMISTPTYADVEPDPEYVEQILTVMVQNPYLVAIADYDENRNVRGVMLGMVSPVWYTQSLRAVQELLYVHPEYRGTRVMFRLIKAFEEESIKRGADSIQLGCSSGEHPDGFAKIMSKLGYSTFSHTYKKEM